MFKYALVLLVFIWEGYYATKQLVGPYEIVIHKIYECNGMPTGRDVMKYGTQFKVYNRTTTIYSSNMTFPNGLTDSMQGLVDISILSNGVWRKNYINFRLNKICSDTTKMFPTLISSVMESAGAPYSGCPLRSGTYNVRNWTFYLQTATGIFPYNTYMVQVTVVEKRKKVACIVVECDVEPKQ